LKEAIMRLRFSNHPCSRAARVGFTILMAFVWCHGSVITLAQAQSAPSAVADRQQAIEALDRLMRLLDAYDRESPRDTFDPAAVVQSVGRDSTKLFEWVRDQTYWVPYQGALRGPVGVLMDHVGSSLDRALLLAELLRVTGEKVRLMHATLSPEQAKQVLGKMRPLPKEWLAPPESSDEKTNELADKYAARFGLEPLRLKAAIEKSALQADRIAEAAAGRAAEQAPLVTKAIEGIETKDRPQNLDRNLEQDATAAAADYWWVSRQDNNQWIDLDPTLPDTKVGSRAVDVQGEPLDYDGKLPANPAVCHEVRLQVTIGRWTAGKLEESPVLKQTLRPADVLGKRVSISYLPVGAEGETDLLKPGGDAPEQRLKDLVAKQHEWVAVLNIGSDTVIQSSFNDAGQINEKPNLDALAATGGSAAGAAKSAISAFDAPAPVESKPDSQLVAQWIDYEIHTPGRPVVQIRRQVFDFVGPATSAAPSLTNAQIVDRALGSLGETEILLQPCQFSQAFVTHLSTAGALANREVIKALASGDRSDPKFTNEQLDQIVPPPGEVNVLALARMQWSPVRGDAYLYQPNILTHHAMFKQNAAGHLVVREGFDIVTNNVAVRASDAAAARNIRLQQGVMDTATEAALAAGGDKVENTSELFTAAIARGEQWITLRDRNDTALTSLAISNEVRSRIEADLTNGYVVLVPKAAAESDGRSLMAWWRINPATGQTLGIGQNGWGTAAAERALIHARIMLKALLGFKCISSAMAGPNAGAGVAMCVAIGAAGAAGIGIGGLGGGVLSYAADILSAMK
jgi:hypothetical protein